MKKLKITAFALIAGLSMQAALAVAPGGALGGGTKGGREEKPEVHAPAVEATGPSTMLMDEVTLTTVKNSTDIVPVEENADNNKHEIGKKAQEGQSANVVDAEAVDAAAEAQMSRKEARKQLKETLKNYAKARKSGEKSSPMGDDMLILYIILCFLLPPLAVFLQYDLSTEFWISLILTFFFWLPGVIYALIVTLR